MCSLFLSFFSSSELDVAIIAYVNFNVRHTKDLIEEMLWNRMDDESEKLDN